METTPQKEQQSKENVLRQEGTVLEAFPGTVFKVALKDDGEILAHISGKMRVNRIKILPGDRVTVELSPYDSKKGRIVYRSK